MKLDKITDPNSVETKEYRLKNGGNSIKSSKEPNYGLELESNEKDPSKIEEKNDQIQSRTEIKKYK